MHLNEGQLRAYLDDESAERATVERHLTTCADCRARADEMTTRAEFIGARFAALASAAPLPSPQVALARFKTRHLRKEIPLMRKIFAPRYRVAWTMIALVALIAVSMTIPPVRAWAEGMLAQFRVSKITVVSIDPTRLNELFGGSVLDKQISQLLSDSITVTKKPGEPRVAATAAEASKLAGFTVRLPSSRTDAPQLTVQDSAAFQFVVKRDRAQALLNDAGASNLKLPASIDGALIKVSIPAAITAAYGTCPKLDADTKETPGRLMINCIVVTQIPSPVVDTPPDLNVAQLAELGLQLTGMTKEQAHAYAQTVDWTSTLVVPVPRNAAQYKKMTVDGVEGYLIRRPVDDAPQYVIVWVKNGIVYAVAGRESDTTNALNMANSLK